MTAQNIDGSTALHRVSTDSTHSHLTHKSPRRYAEVALILLEHGADATVQDKYGRTPFDLVSSGSGLEEVKDVLLRHGLGASPGTAGTHESLN